ncbi:MAG TPA: Vms1/Ankzf1 family peptidyl-tRNA hydrolase [Vicinamibacterales bacterium]|nr:Vms1/Ankzf1 family peptidyl-tRNA hydrolase [Vicinamibacterales bacterium]
MAKSSTSLTTPLRDQLDRLSAFEPSADAPVLSLYLDAQANQHGRDNYGPWLRKTFSDRARTFNGEARKSFDRDVERISGFLADGVRPSANGLIIFACSARDLWEVAQLDAPLDDNWLFIGSVPHLYPLARLSDQYPRYAALLADTNSARLFVFSLGAAERGEEVRNVKTKKTSTGGWSQARYQRHTANFHQQHIKEVVDVLERIVRDESINHIVISCDEVTRPLLMAELPPHLADKVVDTVRLDTHAPEGEVLSATLDALRGHDATTDAERVEALITAWRSNGLGVAGPEDTMQALEMGQVDELLITATPSGLRRAASMPASVAPGPIEIDSSAATAADSELLKLADDLVTKAHQSAARVRFIEDPQLLASIGGVGAFLRFRV